MGVHHSPNQCFSKPANFKMRDEWVANKEAERAGNSKVKSTAVAGMKEISAPSVSVSVGSEPFISFNCEFDSTDEDDESREGGRNEEITASPSIFNDDVTAMVSKLPDMKVWGLLDTGATHHMFKSVDMFEKESVKSLHDSNKQLTMAGGKSSLEVKSKGNMQLKAGHSLIFELKDCLYIPELARNLIAGGLLLRKGVDIVINPNNALCFSLVLKNKALFNGTFLTNNLMLVEIIPVSVASSPQPIESDVSLIDSALLHRQLGHVSNQYLRVMCRKGCLDDIEGVQIKNEDCDVCSMSK